MGDVLLFPAPAASKTNDSSEVWRGCWACGLILFPDEERTGLCTDCDVALNQPPAPTPAGTKPLGYYLKPFGPDGLRTMAAAIVETGTTIAEAQAAGWARDHDLDDRQRAAYVGDVRGRATVEYSARCHADAQVLGALFGWDRSR